MLIWRLRSAKERDAIIEELDNFFDRRVLNMLFKRAQDEKHSFLFVNLLNETDSMFYRNFEQKMLVVDKDDQVPSASQETRNNGDVRALGA